MMELSEKLPEHLKRGPGRPKGRGKVPGSGRRKGVANRSTVQTREFIEAQADPIAFLCRVCRGLLQEAAQTPGDDKRTKVYPTLEQRLHAAGILAKKVIADQKAVDIKSTEEHELIIRVRE